MSHITTDLLQLYRTFFPGPCAIEPKPDIDYSGTRFDAPYREQFRGRDVFLPIHLTNGEYEVDVPCATMRVTGQKTVIRTAVAERIGTVKETYNVGDYQFAIKGVLIAPTGKVAPDDDIYRLRMLFESTTPVQLINAISDLFMDDNRNVCITDLEFPEVEGKELRCRPFSLTCESDCVTNLIAG